ncbi:MAG: hypothetical protein HDR72_04680 [Ruminococcaceae bacterium]|nr:hypothetical protein [Oscillospiraceae bacterium]
MSIKDKFKEFFFEEDDAENPEEEKEKEIFDERQRAVRSRITRHALWAFSILTAVNLFVMECGLRWCESAFAATLVFMAAARLYWVIANVRCGSLYGVHGTAPGAEQACMLAAMLVVDPHIVHYRDKHYEDFWTNFFIRDGAVAQPVLLVLSYVLLVIAAFVISGAKSKEKKGDIL